MEKKKEAGTADSRKKRIRCRFFRVDVECMNTYMKMIKVIYLSIWVCFCTELLGRSAVWSVKLMGSDPH
jgi:hypothetical protein